MDQVLASWDVPELEGIGIRRRVVVQIVEQPLQQLLVQPGGLERVASAPVRKSESGGGTASRSGRITST